MTKRRKSPPGAIVGYVRVSTAAQATEGTSLAAQRERIEAWARAHFPGRDVRTFEDAGVSGRRTKRRPGLSAAVTAARKSRGVLVCVKLDRLARSTRDALDLIEELEGRGAGFVSLSEAIDTTSAAGTMQLTMLAGFAQFEADLASERTAAALQHLKAQGFRVSRFAPLGHDFRNGRLIENAGEQETLRLIVSLRARGLSLRAIANELRDRKVKTKQGRSLWSVNAIASALRRSEAA